jgi:hypothetical protein
LNGIIYVTKVENCQKKDMLLIDLMQHLQQEACALSLHNSVANYQMPVPIRCTCQYKLPQKNENDYNELFISILAHLYPINLNINSYYVIKIIQMIK